MRLKQKMALLLAGVMLAGSVGILNPMEVKAIDPGSGPGDPAADTFTLTVPADTSIKQSGWNSIGDVKVEGNIDTSKMVTVEISTMHGSNLMSEDGEVVVPYSIKNESDKSATKSIVFYAPAVNAQKATSTIGADVEDYNGKAEGTYTDTIIFEATLKEITVDKAGGGKLSLDELGAPSDAFSVGEGGDAKWYVAYTAFIPSTSGSNWQNAKDFVAALNAAEYDGHKDWQLLGSAEMAKAWYTKFPNKRYGGVNLLWSSAEKDEWNAHCLDCSDGDWGRNGKSVKHEGVGFVVIRETEAPQATGVEYELQGSSAPEGKKLTSADLLASKTADASTYSTFKYKGTTYTAYNGYISATAYANWDDAQAFVELLNDNAVDDCDSWTLLANEDMAFEWWQSTAESGQQHETTNIKFGQSSFDEVGWVWSSDSDEDDGYYWNCFVASPAAGSGSVEDLVKNTAWGQDDKSYSDSVLGFVVLRGEHTDK